MSDLKIEGTFVLVTEDEGTFTALRNMIPTLPASSVLHQAILVNSGGKRDVMRVNCNIILTNMY